MTQIPRFCEYTPLTETVATIFNQAEHHEIFNYPPGIRTQVNKRDNTKYYRFHRDTGYTTEECRVLKDEVERLIQGGQLREYVRGANQQPRQPAPPIGPQPPENQDLEVRTIMRGPATGDTKRVRNNYARQARTDPFPHQINLTSHKEKIPRLSDDPIFFTEDEARGLWHPHTNAIVVTLRIAGRKVYRILVDNGSSADILFKSTLNRMNLIGAKIEPTTSYNQIRMHERDQEHRAFLTNQGLYCYKVMPFGLKNASATYQRLVNKMFKEQIGKTMEVYVDDMLVKSLKVEEHIRDLKETFNVLRKYKMKLNPSKCAFGVSSGKYLGFMVNHRGIEANPNKIQALLDMQPP
ncbi:hypothetical protein UlMin_012190 [Ulmus minor]